ncbi:MAG: hypothetical protein SOR95_09975 [Sutterella sp.]|nr:hypothetical protein [Sutterella sp.]
MNIKKKAEDIYSYPVLNNGFNSYVSGEFTTKIDLYETDPEIYRISVDMHLDEKKLLEFIENKMAVYAVYIECNTTAFRKVEQSYTPNISFDLPKAYLMGEYGIGTFVVAVKDIVNYKNDNFNPDYKFLKPEGEPLIEEGSVLAVGEYINLKAIRDHDLKRFESIFEIVDDKNIKDKNIIINFENDPILIHLCTEIYCPVNDFLNTRKKPILESILIFPVLVQTIAHLQNKILKEIIDKGESIDSFDIDCETIFDYQWEKEIMNNLMISTRSSDQDMNEFIGSTFLKSEAIMLAQLLHGSFVSTAVEAMVKETQLK